MLLTDSLTSGCCLRLMKSRRMHGQAVMTMTSLKLSSLTWLLLKHFLQQYFRLTSKSSVMLKLFSWPLQVSSNNGYFQNLFSYCTSYSFHSYCTMHYGAKCSLEIACLSVCLSVCDVGGSWQHKLKILETNCTNNLPNIFALRSPKVIHLLPGEHGEILGRKCSFITYIHNVWLNWVKFNRESRDLRWRCSCDANITILMAIFSLNLCMLTSHPTEFLPLKQLAYDKNWHLLQIACL